MRWECGKRGRERRLRGLASASARAAERGEGEADRGTQGREAISTVTGGDCTRWSRVFARLRCVAKRETIRARPMHHHKMHFRVVPTSPICVHVNHTSLPRCAVVESSASSQRRTGLKISPRWERPSPPTHPFLRVRRLVMGEVLTAAKILARSKLNGQDTEGRAQQTERRQTKKGKLWECVVVSS